MNAAETTKLIDTRLVYGFPDAGKTSYIQDCVMNDRFYKRGYTLVLCFEEGEAAYDEAALEEKNTAVVYYGGGDVKEFCEGCIEAFRPDRIYVEMNSGMPELREQLSECMKVTFAAALIDWDTFQACYAASLQELRQMVAESNQVTFRGCPSRRVLEPYSQAFRVMNPNASYLRQDPMGYHEKAFDLFVPFSLDADEISVGEKEFLPLWLDSFDHPEHYDGKMLRFTDPLEVRRNEADGLLACGRVVMACCMADLQFMSFELLVNAGRTAGTAAPAEGWYTMDAQAEVVTGSYGRRKLRLIPKAIHHAQAPETLILDSRRQ